MPQDEFRIFLSAVTSEFGRARDAVAADLRSREALLRVQSDFRQEAGSDTTHEADPLFRRALSIPARFALAPGDQHRDIETFLNNYGRVLGELNRTEAEVHAAVKSMLEGAREPHQ